MTRSLSLALSFLFASSLFATDFSITPSSGPTAGGTEVTVKGDFGTWPYAVLFDGIAATSTVRVDEHTLRAVTPRHFPGKTNVIVFEYDIGLETGTSFTFEGPVPQGYERVLVPLLSPPVHGAFGSEFHTTLRAFNSSSDMVLLTGIAPPCILSACPTAPWVSIDAGREMPEIEYAGTPGRFVYVPAEQSPLVSFNLRVHDVTRSALNFGTEIPVVHERELFAGATAFLGVPTDARYRNTLRIYANAPTFLLVNFSDGMDRIQRYVSLEPGRDAFEPAFAAIGDFPVFSSGNPMVVTIEPPPTLGPMPAVPYWAFISVTNNETQVITTITPQR